MDNLIFFKINSQFYLIFTKKKYSAQKRLKQRLLKGILLAKCAFFIFFTNQAFLVASKYGKKTTLIYPKKNNKRDAFKPRAKTARKRAFFS